MKKQSYSEAIRSYEENNKDCKSRSKSIWVRFQFKADGIKIGEKFEDQIKPKLHEMMICSKEIDPNTKLLAWKDQSSVLPLHGKEIMLIGGEMIKEYIAASKNPENLTKDKFYYHFGLNIQD